MIIWDGLRQNQFDRKARGVLSHCGGVEYLMGQDAASFLTKRLHPLPSVTF